MLGRRLRGWTSQLKGHKRTFTSILKLSSHHAVNTENKGGKDKLCFGGERRGLFRQQRILHWTQLDSRQGSGPHGGAPAAAVPVVLRVGSKGRRGDRTEASCPRGGQLWRDRAQFKSQAQTSHLLYRKDAARRLGRFCSFFRASPSSSYLQSPASARCPPLSCRL